MAKRTRVAAGCATWALACTLTLAGCAASGASTSADDEASEASASATSTSEGEGNAVSEPDASENEEAASSSEASAEASDEVSGTSVRISFDGGSVTATLAGTQAAREFAAMLPVTLDMSDLNGNEKYAYLDAALTTSASMPGSIGAGDLMLYGDDCLVLFYESFSTSYSYTRIGQVDDVSALDQLASAGNVAVTFEAA